VDDESTGRENPTLVVTCDDRKVFNNSARRFTSLLGTRIQGETGPFPSILLPRGALHSGANNTSGDHVSDSILELDEHRLEGSCHIWTGFP